MKVIGTAGHIDHGKSTLVERLTGIDPDRLAEEKRRGMTIDLGFAWLKLPSGQEASIVDVPGHERFIKNMLAGATGIDVALLVVAADEGVMPQTREHIDILDLLGVPIGVVVLTKSDLVDEEWLALVRAEVEDALAGTTLAGSPIVGASAVTGAGVPQVLQALEQAVTMSPTRREISIAMLPVDRVFTVAGFGTVVTGTLQGGSISSGQELEVAPKGRRVRVRGIQTHLRSVDQVDPGSRVALNLAPLARDQVERGDAVTLPGAIRPVRRFAARVRVLPHLEGGLAHGLRVAVHVGAAEVAGAVSVFGNQVVAPRASGWIQIRLEQPIATVRGQRFILRLPAPLGTVAGGEIVDVQPRYRRRDFRAVDRLAHLVAGDDREALKTMLADPRTHPPAALARSLGVAADTIGAMLGEQERSGIAVRLDSVYVSAAFWDAIRDRAIAELAEFHERNPLLAGMPREELRGRLQIGPKPGAAAIAVLLRDGDLEPVGPLMKLPGRGGGADARPEEVERILSVLRSEPTSPPSGAELMSRAATDGAMLEALHRDGRIVRLADGLYFERSIYDRLTREIVQAIERDGEITVAAVRDRYQTSRKYALAILEHLDDERITRRLGDRRVLGSRRPACA
jgi:selenocysteine-specific elongation factor